MNREGIFRAIAVAGSITAMLLAACAPAAPSAPQPTAAAKPAESKAAAPREVKKLRVTQSVADSVAFIPIYVARYFNYFGDEGLAADVITTAGGGPDVAALVAGEVQFTAAGPNNQLALWQEGKKTLSVASYGDRLTINLVMSKELADKNGITRESPPEKKLAALKGARISITRRGALTDLVARMYASRAGLDPDKDVQIIATQAGQTQIAALEQGQVDMVAASTPTAETIVERGKGILLFYNSGGEDPTLQPFTGYSIIVREDYPRQDPETVKAFVRAIVKANKWTVDHTAEEAAKVMNFYLPSLKVEDIAKNFGYIKAGVPAKGCLTEKGVGANIEMFKAAGFLKQEIRWTDIATNDFLPEKC